MRPRLHFGVYWGVFGFVALLVQAIYRLTPLALEPILAGEVLWWHWVLYGVSILFNGYTEGYRAFHLQVAPRVMARALYLAKHPRPLLIALAPLFCMSLVYATRKRLLISWSVYAAIVVLVVAVRQLPQPWRGMIDAGVVVGLTWGMLSVLLFFFRGAAGKPMPVPADVPDPRRP